MSKAKPKDEKPEIYKFVFYACKNPWHEKNGKNLTHKDILSDVCEIVETKRIK
jgi:hypothetical protein